MEVSNDKYSMNNGTSLLTQHSKQYTAHGVTADTHHMQSFTEGPSIECC